MNISVSAMLAQRLRMDVIAQNIANADTTRTEAGGPYVRQVTVFQENVSYTKIRKPVLEFSTVLKNNIVQRRNLRFEGVQVTQILKDPTPPKPVYDPSHPDADENGYYYLPNVDVAEEQMDALAADNSYQANLTIYNSMKSMAQKALTIGRG